MWHFNWRELWVFPEWRGGGGQNENQCFYTQNQPWLGSVPWVTATLSVLTPKRSQGKLQTGKTVQSGVLWEKCQAISFFSNPQRQSSRLSSDSECGLKECQKLCTNEMFSLKLRTRKETDTWQIHRNDAWILAFLSTLALDNIKTQNTTNIFWELG